MNIQKNNISRDILLKLIEEWENGVIDEQNVHQRAETLMDEIQELPNYPEKSSKSIAVEVLLQLDILNQQLITRDDIPAIRKFLLTPKGKEVEAWNQWRIYWNGLNFEKRKKELKNNPFYCVL